MQDELFLRQWNAHHNVLTAGLNRPLDQREETGPSARGPIGRTYDEPVEANDPPIQVGARIIAASASTVLLWITVFSFATTRGIPFLA